MMRNRILVDIIYDVTSQTIIPSKKSIINLAITVIRSKEDLCIDAIFSYLFKISLNLPVIIYPFGFPAMITGNY
jgi:hypothetical protein